MSTDNTTKDSNSNEIPKHVLDELRENGCSEIFIDVITTPASEAGVQRNSARNEIQRYRSWAKNGEKSVSDFLNYGGGYFQSLREQKREEIPGHADSTNRKLLEYVFETEENSGVVAL